MNIMIVGVGGQGTLLASRILGNVAINQGFDVKVSEVHGMSQRGGSVVTYVKYDDKVYSPLIFEGEADFLLAFEELEAYRWMPYLKKDGVVVAAMKAVRPVTATLTGSAYDGSDMVDYLKANVQNLILVDGEAICAAVGSAKVLNIALLGAALSALNISKEEMEATIRQSVRPQFIEMNLTALNLGISAAKEA